MIGSKVMTMWREIYSAVAVFAVVVGVALGAVACAPDNVARDQDGDAGAASFRTIATPTPGTAIADVGLLHAVTFSDGTEVAVPQPELITEDNPDIRDFLRGTMPLYASKRERTVWPFNRTQREFVGWFHVRFEEYPISYFDEVGRFSVWPDEQTRRCDSSAFAQTDGDWVWHPQGRFCSLKGKFTKVARGSYLGHFKGQDVFCEDTPDPYDLTHGVWAGPTSDTWWPEQAGHCFGPKPVRPISDTTPIELLPEFRDLYPFATATPNPRYGVRNEMTRLIVGEDIVPGLYNAACGLIDPPDFTGTCSIEFRLKIKPGDDDLAQGWVVGRKGWSGHHGELLVNIHACDREILTDFSHFLEATSPEDLQRAADSFPSNFRGGVYERLRAESLEFYGDNCGRDAE